MKHATVSRTSMLRERSRRRLDRHNLRGGAGAFSPSEDSSGKALARSVSSDKDWASLADCADCRDARILLSMNVRFNSAASIVARACPKSKGARVDPDFCGEICACRPAAA